MFKLDTMTDKTFEKYKLVVDEWFVNGFNGTKAYQKFYPKASDETAKVKYSQLVTIGNVSDYIKSKQTTTANKAQMTFENNLNKLEELRIKAEDAGRYNDAINAIKEQNKLLGLYKENNNQKAETKVSFEYPQIQISYNEKKLSLATD